MNKEDIKWLIIFIILLAIVFIIGSKYADKEIDKCVNAGNDRVFCERNV